jgi:antitoxin component YwqK of YwqJK toxin-antitoxin module
MVAVVLVLCLIISQCDSKPAPVVTSHHANGSVKLEKEVDSQGRQHGMTRMYYEDGALESEAEFSHDSMCWVRYFDKDGRLREEQSNGIFSTTRQVWDKDGNLLKR